MDERDIDFEDKLWKAADKRAPKEQYERLNEAVRKMSTPYRSANELVNAQVNDAIEKYEEWRRTKKRH